MLIILLDAISNVFIDINERRVDILREWVDWHLLMGLWLLADEQAARVHLCKMQSNEIRGHRA